MKSNDFPVQLNLLITLTLILMIGARRLISGKDAMIEDYPYVVSIQKDKQHWCAGALLNQRLVITTANCLWKYVFILKYSLCAEASP